jgi:uncharacterized protein (TIGR02246 family)
MPPQRDEAGELSACARLAARQLVAYNAADLEAFLSCYAEDVVVLGEDGSPTMSGRAQMRERYGALFSQCRDVRASVVTRLSVGRHCVDHERWSRVSVATGERTEGEVLVRYTEQGGLIAVVQFLR